MTQNIKILHIFDHSIPLHSGYTFRSQNIVEQQRALGWITDHITSPKHNMATKPQADEELVEGLHFFRTTPAEGLIAKLPIFNQLSIVSALEKRLTKIIPSVKPDIIHAHSPALNGLAALKVAKRFNIPCVYEIRAFWEDAAVDHGTCKEGDLRYKMTRAMETKVIKNADAITTICEGLRGDIIQRGIDESKVTVIPNAVDISKFQASTEKDYELVASLGIENKQVLGFIGSFYAYEGLPLLVKAMSIITKSQNNLRLLLVGGGPQEDEVKKLCTQLGLEDKVIFTGRVPHEKVQAYYNLVDIFAYPRLSMRLTDLVTPLKPLEAMAQRRLVVASDVGGHRELIQDGENGILFKANDENALAAAVISLLSQEDKWESFKNAGRNYVENVRNWRVSVENYKNVYAGLVQQ